MRTKVKAQRSQLVLMSILDAFVQELIDVSDEEILEVAKDLGMDPGMRLSAAFAGVTYPARLQLSDFFDPEERKQLPTADRTANAPPTNVKSRPRRSKRQQFPTDGKPSSDK